MPSVMWGITISVFILLPHTLVVLRESNIVLQVLPFVEYVGHVQRQAVYSHYMAH